MGRGRLDMKPIQKEKARKATFQKRKNGLMKKARELSTLCGVDSCLIIYSPRFNNDQPSTQPAETWPQDPREVHRIIEKYKVKISEKRPKNYDVFEFFKEKKNKVEAETSRLHREKLRMTYPAWDNSFNSLGEDQLRVLVSILDSKLEDCNQRINMSKRKRYLKEKAEESEVAVSSWDASNRSHLSFMQNMSQSQVFPAPMNKLSENNNQLAYPVQYSDNNSESQMIQFDASYMLLMTQNNVAFSYDPVMNVMEKEEARNNQESSLCYYNGGFQSVVRPLNHYPSLQKFPAQNMQYNHEATFQNLPPLMQNTNGYQDLVQAQMFNYMNMTSRGDSSSNVETFMPMD